MKLCAVDKNTSKITIQLEVQFSSMNTFTIVFTTDIEYIDIQFILNIYLFCFTKHITYVLFLMLYMIDTPKTV